MQTEEIPNTDNNYNSLLKISSEEDLFVEDEVTGVKKYTPVTTTDVGQFKREAEHLYKEIQHAKDEFKCKHPTPILAVWTISATFAPC